MPILSVKGVKLSAVAACVPDQLVDNEKACRALYGAAGENIVKATGILKRAVAKPGVSSLDLCVAAAERLFADNRLAREEIGAVIDVTFTPANVLPANALGAQARLGLPKTVLAFDVGLACSGYVYGLYLAGLLVTQLQKKVLLLDGDVQSAWVSPRDKATMPVLSDAGTATLLEPATVAEPWHFDFYSDGSRRSALLIPEGGTASPFTAESLEYRKREDGSERRGCDLYMNGFEVFKFVASDVAKWLAGFLAETGTKVSALNAFVPHQANIYMVKQLGKKLGFEPEQIWISGDRFGNPGSASIPLTLSYVGMEEKPNASQRVLLAGFGAGLSAASALLSLPTDITYSFKSV